MKVNFDLLPFKSRLLVDNRGKTRGLKSFIVPLKNCFSNSTQEDDDMLILTTAQDTDSDTFALISEFGDVMASYRNVFSKYIKSVPFEQLTTRLLNIYKLMKIQAGYNSTIEAYRSLRSECYAKIEAVKADTKMSEFQKFGIIHMYKRTVKECDKTIEHSFKAQKAECESFELTHGLKEVLD